MTKPIGHAIVFLEELVSTNERFAVAIFYGMKFQKANFLLPVRQPGSFFHIAMRGMAAS